MGEQLPRCPARVLLVLLLGCEGFDPSLLQRTSGAASNRDGGPSSEQCPGAIESCNGRDDDCDGKSDEGAEASCRFDHGEGACSAGHCLLASCLSGYGDCNRQMADGCETQTNAAACRVTPVGQGSAGNGRAGGGAEPSGPPGGAGVEAPGPSDDDAGGVCSPSAELCDGLDNDCNDVVDDGPVCPIAMCVQSAPSYRSAGCDQCVCERCATLVDFCQSHPDATWAARCRDLVECVVLRTRAGECGGNGDCYMNGNGPCAAEVNLAAGGTNASDNSRVAAGCSGTPPPSACAAAVNYRDQCTRTTCLSACP